MDYKIELDFNRDLTDLLKNELTNNNYIINSETDDRTIKIQYFNLKKREISQTQRQVLRSSEFNVDQEYKSALNDIEDKITKGENLLPYLSRQLSNLDYNDSLLNDWGIYHLHLGNEIESDGFVKRSGPLLFARFDGQNAYLINIYNHGSWTKQKMIQIIHDNWPESIEQYRINGIEGLSHVPSDDEVKVARKFGFNTMIEIDDGVVYTNIGGGYTTSKQSIEVMQAILRWDQKINDWEKTIKDQIDSVAKNLKEKHGYSKGEFYFKLGIENYKVYAIEKNTNVAFFLEDQE